MRHTVVIYAKCCEARVVPGQVIASPGDSIVFEVLNTEVTLLFPQNILTVEGALPDAAFRLSPEGTYRIEAQVRGGADPGVYPYAVFCTPKMKFAVGASDPEIIIRRG